MPGEPTSEPARSGREARTARSALRLRLSLAVFGLVTCLWGVVVFVLVDLPVVVIIFVVLAAAAVADIVVIQRRMRRSGGHRKAGH